MPRRRSPGRPAAEEEDFLQLLSNNVGSLPHTHDEVLEWEAHVMALQESRVGDAQLQWVRTQALRKGWAFTHGARPP